MTARAIFFGLLAACGAHAAKPAPEARRVATLNAAAMLEAIAAVETGNRAYLVGQRGERGRCQFLHATWVRYTNAEFVAWASRDCELTRRVERAHLAYLLRFLFQPGQLPEPALVAAAWRYGERSALQHVRGDYATRVANLYWESEHALP